MSVTITQAIAQWAAFIGIVAGFWHIDWLAGVAFLAAGFVGVLVHSAGYWRLEENQDPSQAANPNGWPRSRCGRVLQCSLRVEKNEE